MRVGQKNKLTYRWARKGSRPRAVHDQRTQSTYLFGAVCPELGTGAALVLPACNSEAMQLHLDEIAIKVSPGAHAILLLDQAGWHGANILKVPSNITLMPLPPRAPELNGQENIWQFMRQNWLSNRIFKSFDDIVDHCCYAWNTLIDQPWKIMSIARRDWATMGYSCITHHIGEACSKTRVFKGLNSSCQGGLKFSGVMLAKLRRFSYSAIPPALTNAAVLRYCARRSQRPSSARP